MELLKRPTRGASKGGGARSKGAKLVIEFLNSGAVFARERFTNEDDRKSAMLSVKKYVKDAELEETVWPQADGFTILFTNLKLAQQLEQEEAMAVEEAYSAFKNRYSNVGKWHKTPEKKK